MLPHETVSIIATVSQLHLLTSREVKFYGRVIDAQQTEPWILVVEDSGKQVYVDTSSVEGAPLEIGEWYRFMGEVAVGGTTTPMVLLRGLPVRVEDYSSATYEKCLVARDNFVSGIDRLIEYANSTSKNAIS